jgi:RNA polymerase sigma factor (sigma-70 family)
VQRNYRDATCLCTPAAVLCVLILHSNINDYRSSVPLRAAPWNTRSQVTRLNLLICTPMEDPRVAEVSLVPISPEDFAAELQDWAKNDYLYTLVSKEVPESDRRDIAHESWCRVRERHPETINDLASLRSYGARVVRTVTIDFAFGRRRVKRIVHLKGSDAFIERQCLAAGKVTDSPEEVCDQQQREELLYREIATLPQSQRHTLELFHLEGLSAEEVARRRGVTVNTVYNVVKAAVRKLIRKVRKLERDDCPRRGKT